MAVVWLRCAWAVLGIGVWSVAGPARAQLPDFSNVVSLGDSLLDDGSRRRSPLIPEHVTDRLGVDLTQLARGGSTTATLLSQEQHTRAVELGATFAFVWIGGNDFLANQINIGLGHFAFLDTAQANLETALDTLIAGGVRDIVFFNLPDLSVVPAVSNGVMGLPPELQPQLLANFRAASLMWSRRLQEVARARDILLIDVFSFTEQATANPSAFPVLGQEMVPAPASGNVQVCPFCAFADPIHPSSVSVGFLTNLTIARMNAFFGTSIAPLAQTELDLLVQDADTDVINDVADNCPVTSNADQRDSGGVASPMDPLAQSPDRIGDACQCGDADGDGRVTGTDATVQLRCALGLSPCDASGVQSLPGGLAKCGVGGAPGCDGAEGILLRRATLGLPPGIRQVCPAATGEPQ